MKPSHKYWIFILGIGAVIFGVIFAAVAGSWLNLSEAEQVTVAALAEKLLPFPLLGAIILAAVIGGLVSLLFHYYIIPILQMAESTQVISLVNHEYRLPARGAREVIRLAEVINASADAYQKLRAEVDATVRSAHADLKEERNRLAALMSELPSGVLVCSIDGQILLYNQQAQRLLHPPEAMKFARGEPVGWIGLGRSLFGVLARAPLDRGLTLLREAVSRGESMPVTEFTTPLSGGGLLRVTMAPAFGFRCEIHEECVQCERRQMTGFVLTLVEQNPGGETECRPCREVGGGVQPELVGIECTPRPEPRPVSYEFDLFGQRGLQELSGQPLRSLTYVVFDTETTGLEPGQGDEIIQLGAVRIVNGRILPGEVMDQLIDPRRSIPEASVAVHGITREMVDGRPTIEQILPHFHRFVEGAVLVAHNAAFDMACLRLKERRCGVSFDNPVLDTLLLSSVIHPHQESHSIDGIARLLNLTVVGRHTALGDALVTAELLLKLIPLLEARGIVTLADALRASRSSPYARLTY